MIFFDDDDDDDDDHDGDGDGDGGGDGDDDDGDGESRASFSFRRLKKGLPQDRPRNVQKLQENYRFLTMLSKPR